MTTTTEEARYSWGGDEYLFVQMSEAMSLRSNAKAMAMSKSIAAKELPGVIDVCPANAALQLRFDPDRIEPAELEKEVRDTEREVEAMPSLSLETRIFEVPCWYNDPYTSEVVHRFREGFHQLPEGTDLEFGARENGLASVDEFIDRHQSSPWFTSMVGFVAGLPFMYQMVPQDRQLEVPKYLRPRTGGTPQQTVGHGGCFACIYSVEGAGGYQMFGITPVPIFDPEQKLADFSDFMIFFKPGDIVKFRGIDEAEYEEIKAEVEAGTYRYRQVPVKFELDEFLKDRDAYNAALLEALYGN